ncbi:MAG: sigma-70 family RNA polymerase sigma factor [bacterium]
MEIIKDISEALLERESFKKQYECLVRYEAKKHARNAEEAEDIAQDAWLRIFSRFSDLEKSVKNLPAWIRVVIRNAAIDHLKRNRVHHSLEEYAAISSEQAGDDTEYVAITKCQFHEILSEIKDLPTLERKIVAGIVSGESETEIAATLGKSRNAIYLCLHRLRKRLSEREP